MQQLTDDERALIARGLCPDCGYRGFVLGPRGGLAINIECGALDCRSRFNVTMFAGDCVFGERIPKETDGGSTWGADERWQGQHR